MSNEYIKKLIKSKICCVNIKEDSDLEEIKIFIKHVLLFSVRISSEIMDYTKNVP